MSIYGRYIKATLLFEKEDGSDWEENEVDDLVDRLISENEKYDCIMGGGLGPLVDEEEDCNYCEGSGHKDFIEEDDRCGTCGGSGRKNEEEPKSSPEAEQEWHKIYAPVAQGTEQLFPKEQVEGSNPSRSANVWNGCNRESTGEAERQDSGSDDRGDRARCEDPGRNHSGEA